MIPLVGPLSGSAITGPGKASAKEAIEGFEAVFLSRILKDLRETLTEGFGGAGPGGDIYMSLFDQAVSEAMARAGGIGLKDQMMRWLEHSGHDGARGSGAPGTGSASRSLGRP